MENVFEGDLITKSGETYPYTKITGSLDISADAKLPVLTSVGGSLDIRADAKLPVLTSVGGYLYIRADAKLPVLTSVGGSLDISADAKLPVLTSVGGYLDISADAKLPVLTSVGGSLYISADAKLPVLTSVGGSLYISADGKLFAPHAKKEDSTAVQKCRALLLSSFAAAGFSFADGVLARIVSQRGPVSRVVICGQTNVSYLVSDDEGNSAHGDTLNEARADLMVKRTSRDLTQFKAWKLDKVVSKADAIFAYRSITGACAKGTAHWLSQRQTPESLTVWSVIELTRGAYGAETFEKFEWAK